MSRQSISFRFDSLHRTLVVASTGCVAVIALPCQLIRTGVRNWISWDNEIEPRSKHERSE